jgi:hypothetical protein
MGLHNQRVTGSWTTLPYMLSLYQYGTPPTLTVQPNPVPHRELNEEQALAYRAQSIIHGTDAETLRSYADRLLFRLRFVRFFLLPPLYIAVLAFVVTLREFRFTWVLARISHKGCTTPLVVRPKLLAENNLQVRQQAARH